MQTLDFGLGLVINFLKKDLEMVYFISTGHQKMYFSAIYVFDLTHTFVCHNVIYKSTASLTSRKYFVHNTLTRTNWPHLKRRFK